MPLTRSQVMSRIRSTNTKPEMRVRTVAHKLGFRFRLHRTDLPGRPDLVFPSRNSIVFVNGCFWHSHSNCPYNRKPKSSLDYWIPKLEQNASRDRTNRNKLRSMGWNILVIWECETRDSVGLQEKLIKFLGRRTMRSARYRKG